VKQLTMRLADEWGQKWGPRNCWPRAGRTEQKQSVRVTSEWLEYICDRIDAASRTANDLDGAVVFLASEESR